MSINFYNSKYGQRNNKYKGEDKFNKKEKISKSLILFEFSNFFNWIFIILLVLLS